ncbi:MAG: hypothetical protein ABSD63_00975 [Candidatus Korobacteraceae bacterium]|jgi:hypothetical protein
MKLLASALLSLALQVCSASTGKAPATSGGPVQKIIATDGAQSSGTGADRGETLVAQNSAPALDSTSKSQGTSGNRAGEPTQSVKVSELPPLSITKDWSDRAYWLFTFFLVAVGGLQVFLLWGNLRAIERQANQMERQTGILEKSVALAEKNAETARQNIEMFISRERAHLRVDLMPLEWPLPPGPAKLKYKIALHGATEAYIMTSCARAELMDSLEPPDDAKWWPAMSIPQVISPSNRVVEGAVEGIFPKMSLEQADIEAIDAGKKFIHFRGFIRYEDVFGTERSTRFRRVWELSSARNPDGTRSAHWGKRGSPKDNSET